MLQHILKKGWTLVLDGVLLLVYYISAYKSQMAFMRLDSEADKPRMNAELRIMMVELCLKSNWTKLKTTPRGIIIPANRDKTSHVKEK